MDQNQHTCLVKEKMQPEISAYIFDVRCPIKNVETALQALFELKYKSDFLSSLQNL